MPSFSLRQLLLLMQPWMTKINCECNSYIFIPSAQLKYQCWKYGKFHLFLQLPLFQKIRHILCSCIALFDMPNSNRFDIDISNRATHACREIVREQLQFHPSSDQLKYQGGMCPPTANASSNLHSQIPSWKVQLKSQIQRYLADILVVGGGINLQRRPQMTNSDFSLKPLKAWIYIFSYIFPLIQQ